MFLRFYIKYIQVFLFPLNYFTCINDLFRTIEFIVCFRSFKNNGFNFPRMTYNSFVSDWEYFLQNDSSDGMIYPAMVLPNSEFGAPEYQKKYKIKVRNMPYNYFVSRFTLCLTSSKAIRIKCIYYAQELPPLVVKYRQIL